MWSLILAEQFTGVGGASVILELLSKHSVKADKVFNILWKVIHSCRKFQKCLDRISFPSRESMENCFSWLLDFVLIFDSLS